MHHHYNKRVIIQARAYTSVLYYSLNSNAVYSQKHLIICVVVAEMGFVGGLNPEQRSMYHNFFMNGILTLLWIIYQYTADSY